jgi:hypothetical protein
MTDPTAPDGLEQEIKAVDLDAMDLIRKYYALNRDALVLHLAPDGGLRILYVVDRNALIEGLVAELPQMLQDAAKALNEMVKIGRRH